MWINPAAILLYIWQSINKQCLSPVSDVCVNSFRNLQSYRTYILDHRIISSPSFSVHHSLLYISPGLLAYANIPRLLEHLTVKCLLSLETAKFQKSISAEIFSSHSTFRYLTNLKRTIPKCIMGLRTCNSPIYYRSPGLLLQTSLQVLDI
jgi:hypothetical protein